MNDDENNVEQNEQQTPKSVSGSKSPITRINDAARGASNLIHKGINKGKKAISIPKKLFNHATRNVKIILGIVVISIAIIVIIVQLIADNYLEIAKSVVADSAKKAFTYYPPPDQQNDTQKKAAESYEKTGSMLYFQNEDITNMKEYLESIRTTGSKEEKAFYEVLLTEYGSNTAYPQRIDSLDDKLTLYEHILLTSKYNFNDIKWKHYGHSVADGSDSPLKEDLNLGVRYPADQNNTEYDTFLKLTSQYLYSHEIILSIVSGLIDDTKGYSDEAGKMAYSVLKHGMTDMTVNRYDVETYVLHTSYDDYMHYNRYETLIVVGNPYNSPVYDSQGNPVKDKNGNQVYEVKYTYSYKGGSLATNTTSEEHVITNLENGAENPMLESYVDHNINIINKYFVKEAKSFDIKIENDYTYTKYNQDDVNNRRAADYEQIYNQEDINDVIGAGHLEEGQVSGISGGDINAIANSLGCRAEYSGSNGGVIEYKLTGAEYQKNEGTRYYRERSWADTLSQNSSKKSEYSMDDLLEFNANYQDNPITADTYNSDKLQTENEYYSDLESRKILNRVDFINFNSKIYKEYINSNSNFSKYIGYRRNSLGYVYDNLKTYINSNVKDYGSNPYVWGNTIVPNSSIKSGSGGGTHLSGGGKFIWPLPEQVGKGCISDVASGSVDPDLNLVSIVNYYTCIGGRRTYSGHTGLDISPQFCDQGTVVAAADGVVVISKDITTCHNPGKCYHSEGYHSYGRYVKIKHTIMEDGEEKTYYTLYAHMNSRAVEEGQEVKQGDVIGIQGNTGNSSGKHLHFEIQDANGQWLDPVPFFNPNLTGIGGGVVEGDIASDGTVSQEEINQLLAELDADASARGSAAHWGSVNNAWTLRYYMDNDVELIARIICHENSLWDSSENDDGAHSMVECMTYVMMNRIANYGSAYEAILAKSQFYSGAGRMNAFNKAPPQWMRELINELVSGSKEVPDYLAGKEGFIYQWAGPADTKSAWTGSSSVFGDVSQIVGVKVNSYTWHVFLAPASSVGSRNRSLITAGSGNRGVNWNLVQSHPAPGHTNVFLP